jgi:hypothetical protein
MGYRYFSIQLGGSNKRERERERERESMSQITKLSKFWDNLSLLQDGKRVL